MTTPRLTFGDALPPADRNLCASLVRGRDDTGALTQDVCSHDRREHQPKRGRCTRCTCPGFTVPVGP